MFRLLNIEEFSEFLECKIETLKETSETEKEKAGAKICEATTVERIVRKTMIVNLIIVKIPSVK